MSTSLAVVGTTVRGQHGLVTIEQLHAAGITGAKRRRLLEAGEIVPVFQGVYRSGLHDVSFEQRCLAACLARPDVVVSGPSNGRLIDLRSMPIGPVHVLSRRRVDLADVVAHRTRELRASDVVRRPDGIRTLRPARLIVDLARFLDDEALESVIEQLLDRRMVTMPALIASARRLRRSGRDGSVRLARVLSGRPAWMRPKDSHLEVRLLRALADRGVVLEPQLALDLGDVVIHLDGGDRQRRFGVEVDHVTWHGGRLQTQADKWRDRQAARIGWQIVRVTDDDLAMRFRSTVDDLVEIHRNRPTF